MRITFVQASGLEQTVEATDGDNLMKIALANDVRGIVADCGGELACATCHVKLDETTYGALGEPSEEEREMLDCAIDTESTSRLSCQVAIKQTGGDWTVRIPAAQI